MPKSYTDYRPTQRQLEKLPKLTAKELATLQHAAKGMENTEIATTMKLGRETVKTHMAGVIKKYRARNRAHAIHIAYEAGTLTVPGRYPLAFVIYGVAHERRQKIIMIAPRLRNAEDWARANLDFVDAIVEAEAARGAFVLVDLYDGHTTVHNANNIRHNYTHITYTGETE